MNTKLIIPIINKSSNFLNENPFSLSNDIYITNISDKDFYSLHKYYDEDYLSYIKSDTNCIYAINADINDTRGIIILVKFILNFFKKDNPIFILGAATIKEETKSVKRQTYSPGVVSDIFPT